MLSDSRYENNIILQKEALQGLLTNIKNYPVIDIDYIAEDEVDDKDRPIWINYTEGTPCIKITYGDYNTTKGNIIFADKLRKKIRDLTKELNQTTEARDTNEKNIEFWTKVYRKNKEVFDNRKQSLEYYGENNITAESMSDKDAVDAIGRLLKEHFDSSYEQYYTEEYNDDYPLWMEQDLTIKAASNTSSGAWTTYTVKATVLPATGPQSRNLYLAYLNGLLNSDNITEKQHQAVEDLITAVTAFPFWEQLALDASAPEITDDKVRNIQYYVIEFLRNVVRLAEDKMNAAADGLQAAKDAVNNNNSEIERITRDIEKYNGYIEDIASGQYKLIEENNEYSIEPNYTEVETGTQYDSTLDYFQKINNDYVPYTYNENTWAASIENGLYSSKNLTMYGHKYVKVGSNIQFDKNLKGKEYTPSRDVESYKYPEVDPNSAYQRNGHFKITINGHVYEVGIKGLEDSDDEVLKINTNVLPTTDGAYSLGQGKDDSAIPPIPEIRWKDIYGENAGSEASPFEHGYFNEIKIGNVTIGSEDGTGNSAKFLRGDGQWASQFIGYGAVDTTSGFDPNINYFTRSVPYGPAGRYQDLYTPVTDTSGQPQPGKTYYTNNVIITFFNNSNQDGTEYTEPNYILNSSNVYDSNKTYYTDNQGTVYTYSESTWETDYASLYIIDTPAVYSINRSAAIYTTGGIAAEKNIWAKKVFNAVFNDYAEYRESIEAIKPGCCVREISDNGELGLTQSRLMPGAQIVSDTFGHSMGMTNNAQTPVAVAGRVLAYTYQDRNNYHTGMAVCSAPNGTIDIMTREEMIKYPDAIIGIVSEIPSYDTWGSDNVNVDGRIWIKVR